MLKLAKNKSYSIIYEAIMMLLVLLTISISFLGFIGCISITLTKISYVKSQRILGY